MSSLRHLRAPSDSSPVTVLFAQQEEGLRVSVTSSGQWLAKGLGTGDAYYSLEAQLVGDKLVNGVVYASGK